MSDQTASYRVPEQTDRLTGPAGRLGDPVDGQASNSTTAAASTVSTSTVSTVSTSTASATPSMAPASMATARVDEPPASPPGGWPALRGQLPIESLGLSQAPGRSYGQLHDRPRERATSTGKLLKGLGLLGIAIASGVLWWAVRHHPANADVGAGQPAGKYSFSQAHSPLRDSNCAAHSYGKTKTLFEQTPCVALVQTLYTTTVDGTKLFSSVSVVQMDNVADAAKLEQLTQQDGTGNVSDVLTEKAVSVPGAPASLADGGFEATRDGAVVTIVESGPAVGGHASNDLLKTVSHDALRLGGATALGN